MALSYSHFTDEEPQAQTGEVTPSVTAAQEVAELGP